MGTFVLLLPLPLGGAGAGGISNICSQISRDAGTGGAGAGKGSGAGGAGADHANGSLIPDAGNGYGYAGCGFGGAAAAAAALIAGCDGRGAGVLIRPRALGLRRPSGDSDLSRLGSPCGGGGGGGGGGDGGGGGEGSGARWRSPRGDGERLLRGSRASAMRIPAPPGGGGGGWLEAAMAAANCSPCLSCSARICSRASNIRGSGCGSRIVGAAGAGL